MITMMKQSMSVSQILAILLLIIVGVPRARAQAPIVGFADIHAHQFANLSFGGKAYVGKAFGPIDQALPWCDCVPGTGRPPGCDWVHGPGGTRDLLDIALRGAGGHHVGGFPEFDGWPRWNSKSHQLMYEDWLFRAYQGGLRLMVVMAGNNEFVCSLVERAPGRTCDDMEAIRLQIEEAKRMEADLDRRSGGPGRGWYRIVYSPRQARDVIAQGKLAVVLGAEVSNLFGCKLGAGCTEAYVREQLDYWYNQGLRHIFPVHYNTNEFGGPALFNILTTARCQGAVCDVRDCTDEGYRYNHPRYVFQVPPGRATCNAVGLTNLGKFLVKEMARKKMILDIDHMSALAVNDALDLAERYDPPYPVVSGHPSFIEISRGTKLNEANRTRAQLERIRRVGGMVSVILGQEGRDKTVTYGGGPLVVEHRCGNSSESFAQAYLYAITQMQLGPVAFATDTVGAELPAPRFGGEACNGDHEREESRFRLQYPFTALATGARMDRSVVGQKTFDFNTDGFGHVGLYPDLIADLNNLFGGRSDLLNPLLSSAEGYVRMWERIEGPRDFRIYVDSNAVPSGDGSPQHPFKTVREAIDAVSDSSSVLIKPGSYPENLTISKRVKLDRWPGTADALIIGR